MAPVRPAWERKELDKFYHMVTYCILPAISNSLSVSGFSLAFFGSYERFSAMVIKKCKMQFLYFFFKAKQKKKDQKKGNKIGNFPLA